VQQFTPTSKTQAPHINAAVLANAAQLAAAGAASLLTVAEAALDGDPVAEYPDAQVDQDIAPVVAEHGPVEGAVDIMAAVAVPSSLE
jgi:hypothetical protein